MTDRPAAEHPTPPRPGPRNLFTDVPGVLVGNATDAAARTGATVILCETQTTAAVDVRGGAPGTRETDALGPEALVGAVDAIVLSGGSAHGLAAADGVMNALRLRGRGVALGTDLPSVPIVPAAILFDLGPHSAQAWGQTPPFRDLGGAALAAAGETFGLGSVGAGAGAKAGAVKGGLGSASLDLGNGIFVSALIAANPIGSVLTPGTRHFWAWPFEIDAEFGGLGPPPPMSVTDPIPADAKLAGFTSPRANTTIGAVAVSAALTSVECRRIAFMAQDGLARAVRPAHTPLDGDTIFALAPGGVDLPEGMARTHALTRIGSAAADCVARATARAVYAATAWPGERPAWKDL